MTSIVQKLAEKVNISFNEFIGEMRKRGCSESTAAKIWRGEYEKYDDFNDNNMSLSNLRKAADILKVREGRLFPQVEEPGKSLVVDLDYKLMKQMHIDHSSP